MVSSHYEYDSHTGGCDPAVRPSGGQPVSGVCPACLFPVVQAQDSTTSTWRRRKRAGSLSATCQHTARLDYYRNTLYIPGRACCMLYTSHRRRKCSLVREPPFIKIHLHLLCGLMYIHGCSCSRFSLADILVLVGTAGAGIMTPPTSTKISAMKCVQGHSSPINPR